MKKFFILSCALFASVSAMAQLRVNSNGNIGIGDYANGFYKMYAKSNNDILGIVRDGIPDSTLTNTWTKGLVVQNNAQKTFFNIGIWGQAYSTQILGGGRSYGLWGIAGNTSTGYNYGVYGELYSTQNGAGIYGTIYPNNGINVGGRYAGFFHGNVKITGSLSVSVLTTPTTSNNNAQISLIDNSSNDENVTEKLSQLSTIEYNLTPPISLTATNVNDTLETVCLTDMELQAIEKNHYGLLATQLQELYPNLVYQNPQGELSINYIEMIPLLVESIKELKAEIAELQGGNNGGVVLMSRSLDNANSMEENSLTIPVLEQNNPNPFTENTVIGYTLPESVQTATLYIYDMNGTQVHQMTLTERGSSSVTVSGGELSAGMYLYSLIADGKVINTKRMILTK